MRFLIAAVVFLPIALIVGGYNGATIAGCALAIAAITHTIRNARTD